MANYSQLCEGIIFNQINQNILRKMLFKIHKTFSSDRNLLMQCKKKVFINIVHGITPSVTPCYFRRQSVMIYILVDMNCRKRLRKSCYFRQGCADCVIFYFFFISIFISLACLKFFLPIIFAWDCTKFCLLF